MSNSIEALRIAARDGALSLSERKTSASHLIDAQLAEVPEPAETDAEVPASMHQRP